MSSKSKTWSGTHGAACPRAMTITCPVCVSTVIRSQVVTAQTIVCACDACRTIFTIQLGALPKGERPPTAPSDT
jgi:hypothetical protein